MDSFLSPDYLTLSDTSETVFRQPPDVDVHSPQPG
jgi:hypothetical protein